MGTFGNDQMIQIKSGMTLPETFANTVKTGSFSSFMRATPVTRVFGFIKAIATIVDVVLNIFGTNESSELQEIKQLYHEMTERFNSVDIKLRDLASQITWTTTEIQFGPVEQNINSNFEQLQHIYNLPLTIKDIEKKRFMASFKSTCLNCASNLFRGILGTDTVFTGSILKKATTAFKYDRRKSQNFMIGTLQLLTKAVAAELIYERFEYGENYYQTHQVEWTARIQNVTNLMQSVDQEVEKYYWRDWLVIVYNPIWGIKAHINHVCDGYRKYGVHGRDVAIATVDKSKPAINMKESAEIIMKVSYSTCSRLSIEANTVYNAIDVKARTCSLYGSVGVISSNENVWFQGPSERLLHTPLRYGRHTVYVFG
ncbi:unnamed protein product [Mytilus coruscus]|uniref:Uncharacterized protein n=1 Tax=Mytilus coruscus TaxID=42192 RepID=A0A6J8D9J5_MYTCO|nr:unnamed protein product [Mytilus coruscus]